MYKEGTQMSVQRLGGRIINNVFSAKTTRMDNNDIAFRQEDRSMAPLCKVYKEGRFIHSSVLRQKYRNMASSVQGMQGKTMYSLQC